MLETSLYLVNRTLGSRQLFPRCIVITEFWTTFATKRRAEQRALSLFAFSLRTSEFTVTGVVDGNLHSIGQSVRCDEIRGVVLEERSRINVKRTRGIHDPETMSCRKQHSVTSHFLRITRRLISVSEHSSKFYAREWNFKKLPVENPEILSRIFGGTSTDLSNDPTSKRTIDSFLLPSSNISSVCSRSLAWHSEGTQIYIRPYMYPLSRPLAIGRVTNVHRQTNDAWVFFAWCCANDATLAYNPNMRNNEKDSGCAV